MSKYWQTKCDQLWGEIIHRSNDGCLVGLTLPDQAQYCTIDLEAHHLVSRARLETRTDPDNGVLLCSFHHRASMAISPHNAPLGFKNFLEDYYPHKYDYMIKNKSRMQQTPNFKKIFQRLIFQYQHLVLVLLLLLTGCGIDEDFELIGKHQGVYIYQDPACGEAADKNLEKAKTGLAVTMELTKNYIASYDHKWKNLEAKYMGSILYYLKCPLGSAGCYNIENRTYYIWCGRLKKPKYGPKYYDITNAHEAMHDYLVKGNNDATHDDPIWNDMQNAFNLSIDWQQLHYNKQIHEIQTREFKESN